MSNASESSAGRDLFRLRICPGNCEWIHSIVGEIESHITRFLATVRRNNRSGRTYSINGAVCGTSSFLAIASLFVLKYIKARAERHPGTATTMFFSAFSETVSPSAILQSRSIIVRSSGLRSSGPLPRLMKPRAKPHASR